VPPPPFIHYRCPHFFSLILSTATDFHAIFICSRVLSFRKYVFSISHACYQDLSLGSVFGLENCFLALLLQKPTLRLRASRPRPRSRIEVSRPRTSPRLKAREPQPCHTRTVCLEQHPRACSCSGGSWNGGHFWSNTSARASSLSNTFRDHVMSFIRLVLCRTDKQHVP